MGSKPKTPKKSATQKKLEAYQLEDIEKLRAKEKAQREALARGRLGRASLMSGAPITMPAPANPAPVVSEPKKKPNIFNRTRNQVARRGFGKGGGF